ncbi:MAG: putative transport system permease protein [Phycisphaerales bacterium]|jgi:putative ABC transport system permease protein|nr:putative transport system permease protein [Phycisphaerales bacterium]
MNLIALKMLVGDRLKYISLVAGIAFAALLVTQQSSIFTGFARQMSAWIRDTNVADLWVMDEQVEFVDDFKPMAETKLQRIRSVDGVQWAVPLYKNYLRTRLPDGTAVQTRVVGLDDATLTGAPEIVEGRVEDLRRDRAVMINIRHASTLLALKRDGNKPLKIGDRISINDNEAIVVGFYRATREFFWDPVIYTTYTKALNWAPRERKQLGFILVKAQENQDLTQLAERIKSQTGLVAYTGDQFANKTMTDLLSRTGILINFGITIALGFVIGVLVAGQTFFNFVLDNLRHFAALKAMGLRNLAIIRMVLLQLLTVGLIGYGIGLGGAVITGAIFSRVGLAFEMPWQIPVLGAVAILGCCLGAGIISLVRVMRMEPGIVFRA